MVIAPDKFKGSLTARQAATAMSLGCETRGPRAADGGVPRRRRRGRHTRHGACRGIRAHSGLRDGANRAGDPDRVRPQWGHRRCGDGRNLWPAAASRCRAGTDDRIQLRPGSGRRTGTRPGLPRRSSSASAAARAPMAGPAFSPRSGRTHSIGTARASAQGEAASVTACGSISPACGPKSLPPPSPSPPTSTTRSTVRLGAANVYAPQKGANPEQVAELDQHCVRGQRSSNARRRPTAEASPEPAPPAASVLPRWPCWSALASRHRNDPRPRRSRQASGGRVRAITGEGSLDHQSLRGKAVVGVSRHAGALGIPTYAVAGVSTLSPADARSADSMDVHTLSDLEPDRQRSIERAADLLAIATERLTRASLSSVMADDRPMTRDWPARPDMFAYSIPTGLSCPLRDGKEALNRGHSAGAPCDLRQPRDLRRPSGAGRPVPSRRGSSAPTAVRRPGARRG